MIKIKSSNFYVFLLVNGILCFFYCLVFKPISYEAMGDAPAYINLAKQIFNFSNAPIYDLSSRSPFYSIILGVFMLLFGQTSFILPVIVFQYVLIFLTSIIIYKLFFLVTGKQGIAFIVGTISSINLSTVFYAYTIASETISIFLFSYMAFQTVKYYKTFKLTNLFTAGIFSALLVLARFNTIGIPFVIIIILFIYYLSQISYIKLTMFCKELIIFVIPVIVILNSWALYNYFNNGFYNLLPPYHTGQRWAIPATINNKNTVSDKFAEVLYIFQKNGEKQKQSKSIVINRRGSLLDNTLISKINGFFSQEINGYYLYKASEKQLLEHYQLPDTPNGINQLGINLMPFYNEIAKQNKRQLLKLKVYSFLYTFKSNSPVLPGNFDINLNKLPIFILIIYKLVFILVMLIVFLISIAHTTYIFFKRQVKYNIGWIILYGFMWYFPIVNFYANVLSDANRFKYPAESIILGLFICYFYFIIPKIQKKWITLKLSNNNNL